MDNNLFIEELPEDKQPGTYVRRINGKELNDEEMIEYYTNLVKENGGKLTAKWVYGMVIYSEKGIKEYTWAKDKFNFITKPCAKRNPGYPLDSITIVPEYNKYLVELTEEDKKHYKKKDNIDEVIKQWSNMVTPLYNKEYGADWTKYINDLILFDKNYFTLQCASNNYCNINENILNAAKNDVGILTSLSKIKCSDFKDLLYFKFPYDKDIIDTLAAFDTICQTLSFDRIVNYHENNGVGILQNTKPLNSYQIVKLNPSQTATMSLLKT